MILKGEPNASSNPALEDSLECFPPALQAPFEPLAGDLRSEGDGKERGFLKILAGIADIGFDDLYRRHERAQRKRRLILGTVAAAVIAALAGLSVFALNQKSIAEAQSKVAKQQTEEAEKERKRADKERDLASKNESRALKSEAEAEKESQRARDSEAAAQFQLAWARWGKNRVAEARDLLGQIRKEYRNIEWSFSNRHFSGSDLTLYGHTDRVRVVSFSPDGKRIISSSGDDTIRIWDASNGTELLKLPGAGGNKADLRFSPDGTRIIGGSGGQTIRIWDASTGKALFTCIGVNGSIRTCSPDGTRFLEIANGRPGKTIKLIEISGFKTLLLSLIHI